MSNKDNGGPAFPMPFKHGELDHSCDGMTLRDYFAAKAMAALLGSTKTGGWLIGEGGKDNALIAHLSYVIADAMLGARK